MMFLKSIEFIVVLFDMLDIESQKELHVCIFEFLIISLFKFS